VFQVLTFVQPPVVIGAALTTVALAVSAWPIVSAPVLIARARHAAAHH
jgi:hypothetical protein